MITNFEGPNADEVWLQAVERFQGGQDVADQMSRAGATKELLHAAFSIDNPTQRWIVSRQPPINPAFALAEVVWIVTGRRDVGFLSPWNSQLTDYVGDGPELHGAYGYRLREHFGLDQLEQAFRALESDANTRQVVLQIWDGRVDLPEEDGKPRDRDIPCNTSSLLKLRSGRLEWLQILRSNDMFRGVPYNFVQFTSLQEILAGWLGAECGSYVHLSDSLHIYADDLASVVESRMTVDTAANTDALGLPFEESIEVFRQLENRAVQLASMNATAASIEKTVQWDDAPTAYRNILMILGAQAARNKREPDLAESIVEACTNPAYRQLWSRWRDSRTTSRDQGIRTS